jgi:hypothetical protein
MLSIQKVHLLDISYNYIFRSNIGAIQSGFHPGMALPLERILHTDPLNLSSSVGPNFSSVSSTKSMNNTVVV